MADRVRRRKAERSGAAQTSTGESPVSSTLRTTVVAARTMASARLLSRARKLPDSPGPQHFEQGVLDQSARA